MPSPHPIALPAPPASRQGLRCLLPGLLAVTLALTACSPTYNWREIRPAGSPLLALMPCKPEQAERPAPLGESSVTLHMHSCETGGLTFAVAWAELAASDPSTEALARWRGAALAAIRVDPARAGETDLQWTPAMRGADQALGLVAQGTQHDQRTVQMRAAHFSRGQQVYQAAIYGPALPDEVVTTFFEGLRLP